MLHISELITWIKQKSSDRRTSQLPAAHRGYPETDRKGSDQVDLPASDSLPRFEGYPYLITRLVPSLFHITLLPDTVSRHDLFDIAAIQRSYNRLECCLIYGADNCCYFTEEGQAVPSNNPPSGGEISTNGLVLPFAPEPTPSFKRRSEMLSEFKRDCGITEYRIVMAYLTKGGTPASREQSEMLRGKNLSGGLRGLSRCAACGEWRGICLDPAIQTQNVLVRVSCLCDNNNLCARCHGKLGPCKLNSSFYDPEDGKVHYVPAFLALEHDCGCERECK